MCLRWAQIFDFIFLDRPKIGLKVVKLYLKRLKFSYYNRFSYLKLLISRALTLTKNFSALLKLDNLPSLPPQLYVTSSINRRHYDKSRFRIRYRGYLNMFPKFYMLTLFFWCNCDIEIRHSVAETW